MTSNACPNCLLPHESYGDAPCLLQALLSHAVEAEYCTEEQATGITQRIDLDALWNALHYHILRDLVAGDFDTTTTQET